MQTRRRHDSTGTAGSAIFFWKLKDAKARLSEVVGRAAACQCSWSRCVVFRSTPTSLGIVQGDPRSGTGAGLGGGWLAAIQHRPPMLRMSRVSVVVTVAIRGPEPTSGQCGQRIPSSPFSSDSLRGQAGRDQQR